MAKVKEDPFPEGNPPDDAEPFMGTEFDPALGGLRKMQEPFPPEKISKLEKHYTNKRTGQEHTLYLDYVGHADITERLLQCDPYWSWQPMGLDEHGCPLMDKDPDGSPVGLWIRLTVCGVTRIGYGSCEGGKQEAVKELIGDALRNAAMRFGAGLELWSKSDRSASHEPSQEARKPRSRPRPVAEPAPVSPESLAEAFGGSEEPPIVGDVTVLGIKIPRGFKPEGAMNHVLAFGKHKGMTYGALAKSKEGRGYIEWLANKTATEVREGRRLPQPGDYLVLLAFDSFQHPPASRAGHAVSRPQKGEPEGDQSIAEEVLGDEEPPF
jgi:hypothetical protein